MFWITENHFLFVGLFDWGNAETQTFSVSRNWDDCEIQSGQTLSRRLPARRSGHHGLSGKKIDEQHI